MYLFKLILVLCVCIECIYGQNLMNWRRRLNDRIRRREDRNTARVCYDIVGCFKIGHIHSPLQKIPENPKTLGTKFYLFKRDVDFSNPQVIYYEDNGKSLVESKFNASLPLKVLVHGYMTMWNGKGNILATDTYLKIDDYNVLVMDWNIGARGPHYSVAAANTEVVGRQLGVLLYEMIKRGLNPNNIHLIGFSLGAHVSGCASEYLKNKGLLIGRITGLDAASPLFRQSSFKEKHKKLDKEDAKFVDVVHTDSSPIVVDGFGLWEPIGHVDFFPNGGQDQPGCQDKKPSVLLSQIEGTLTVESACSHIRAFHIFIDSLLNQLNGQCQFTAYKCSGGVQAFQEGECFPLIDKLSGINEEYRTDLGVFGGENSRGSGVMYLATRGSRPFCGTQLHISMYVTVKKSPCEGTLQLKLMYNNNSATYFNKTFNVPAEDEPGKKSQILLKGITTVDYNGINPTMPQFKTGILFTKLANSRSNNNRNNNNNNNSINVGGNVIYVTKIVINDMYGNSWHTCVSSTIVRSKDTNWNNNSTEVMMYQKKC